MIKKILIANRGEIACRVMETCQAMGIKTVAVFSDADKKARHRMMADEAVHIGPSEAQKSYLDIDKIMDAIQQTGADAVHPGYGFLSENTEFAARLEKEGVTFIGPSQDAILAMGEKSKAKALMAEADVPLVPGYHGDNQDPAFLKAEADKMGYPLLIKASAGGGGKGMELVTQASDFEDALSSAVRTAVSAFGNGHVLLEKFVEEPRHIEIQVFGDTHDQYVYLFERDCSIQRRHQKIVEEAPAPGMTEELRAKMGEAAVAAARAIDYTGAGTVEFLLDKNGDFYFMEMNTRLQVEHPVTEMITGEDLVSWQIKVAQGEKLPKEQDELTITGHAVEVRIYAEDPQKDFQPSVGQVTHFTSPVEDANIRLDTGIDLCEDGRGGHVSMFYDPMVAKLITWGEERDIALANMGYALRQTLLTGVANNIPYLTHVIDHDAFVSGGVTTHFIEEYGDALLSNMTEKPHDHVYLYGLAFILRQQLRRQYQNLACGNDFSSPWHETSSWRIGGVQEQTLSFAFGDETCALTYKMDMNDQSVVSVTLPDDETYDLVFDLGGNAGEVNVMIDGDWHLAQCYMNDADMLFIASDFGHHQLKWQNPVSMADASADGHGKLTAPMPGKVVAVHVEMGDEVSKGQPLVVMEAMKMEHTIVAPQDGIIADVQAKAGMQIDDKLELVSFQA